ncbi:hypothetical protein Mapa_017132 [Marchantia paleacea]|nr:hypothetical protein Mapa_017132 [Marchantia paleacea]
MQLQDSIIVSLVTVHDGQVSIDCVLEWQVDLASCAACIMIEWIMDPKSLCVTLREVFAGGTIDGIVF